MTASIFDTGDAPIGTYDMADRALAHDLPFLNDGLYKRVHLDYSGAVVYKIAKGTRRLENESREQIAAEAAWSANLREHGVPGIPPVSVYRVNGRLVLAMPYYEGAPYDATDEDQHDYTNAWSRAGLSDMHSDNWATDDDGKPVAIDLAGHAHYYPSDSLPDSDSFIEHDLEGSFCGDCECEPCECGDDQSAHEPCGDCGDCIDCGECVCDEDLTVSTPATVCSGAYHCKHPGGFTTRVKAHNPYNVPPTCGIKRDGDGRTHRHHPRVTIEDGRDMFMLHLWQTARDGNGAPRLTARWSGKVSA